MKPSEKCKRIAGITLNDMARITGKTVQTLINWDRENPALFDLTLAGIKMKKADDAKIAESLRALQINVRSELYSMFLYKHPEARSTGTLRAFYPSDYMFKIKDLFVKYTVEMYRDGKITKRLFDKITMGTIPEDEL